MQPARLTAGIFARAGEEAARRLRRTIRLPAEAYAGTSGYLSNTLDWFKFWHHDTDSNVTGNYDSHSSSNFSANSDYLSPRL